MRDGRRPRFGFSTLACPEWRPETVIGRAAEFGFDAIEWRGGPDGTVRPDWSSTRRQTIRRAVEAQGLASIAVTSYPDFICGDGSRRRRSIDDVRAHIDLAADLGAAFVRIFLGVRDDDEAEDVLVGRAVESLETLLERAAGHGVALAIEPHDDHVRVEAVRPVLDALDHPLVRVVWDIANAWAAGESPDRGLAGYDGRIGYVQVKDGIGRGRDWRLCRLGDGEVPIGPAITALLERAWTRGDDPPVISVEWERAWHPELDRPDVALPAARAWLAGHTGLGGR